MKENFITDKMLDNYLSGLVNKFFKILPMKEDNEPSVNEYMSSLQVELIGSKNIVKSLGDDAMYMTIISILQYLIDEDCDIRVVKREVFKAISCINKLSDRYVAKKE